MPEQPYRLELVVRWGDLDANGHMANTAYLDACVDVRFGYFAHCGLDRRRFDGYRIGPVVRRDEVDYFRELRFLDRYTVDLLLAGISDDASHFSLQNRFFRADETLVARVVSTGGWMDLAARRLVAPPQPVREALLTLERAEGFRTLSSSVR